MDFLLSEGKLNEKIYWPIDSANSFKKPTGNETSIEIPEAFSQYQFTKDKEAKGKYKRVKKFDVKITSVKQQTTAKKGDGKTSKRIKATNTYTFYFDITGSKFTHNFTIDMGEYEGFPGTLPVKSNHWFEVKDGKEGFIKLSTTEHWSIFAFKWKNAWLEFLNPGVWYNKCLNLKNPWATEKNCDVYVINPVLLDVEKYFNPLYKGTCWVPCDATVTCQTVYRSFKNTVYHTMETRLLNAIAKGEIYEMSLDDVEKKLGEEKGKVWVSTKNEQNLYVCIRNFLGLVQLGYKNETGIETGIETCIMKNVLTYSEGVTDKIITLDKEEKWERGLSKYLNNKEKTGCILQILRNVYNKSSSDFKFETKEKDTLNVWLEDTLRKKLAGLRTKYKFFCKKWLEQPSNKGELPKTVTEKINKEKNGKKTNITALPQIVEYNNLETKLYNSMLDKNSPKSKQKCRWTNKNRCRKEIDYGTPLVSNLLYSLRRDKGTLAGHAQLDWRGHVEFYIIGGSDFQPDYIITRTFVRTEANGLNDLYEWYCEWVAKVLYRLYITDIRKFWEDFVKNNETKLLGREEKAKKKEAEDEKKANDENAKKATECKVVLKKDIEENANKVNMLEGQLKDSESKITELKEKIIEMTTNEQIIKDQLDKVRAERDKELADKLAAHKLEQEEAMKVQKATEDEIKKREAEKKKEAQKILGIDGTTEKSVSTPPDENTLKIKLRF